MVSDHPLGRRFRLGTSSDENTYCVGCIDVNVGLKVFEDFIEVACTGCPEECSIAIGLEQKREET